MQLAVAVALLAGLTGLWAWAQKRGARGLGVELGLATGAPFVGLGILLGPLGAGILDRSILALLAPLITLSLGVFGVVVGIDLGGIEIGNAGGRSLGGRLRGLGLALADVGLCLALVGVPLALAARLGPTDVAASAWPVGLALGASAALSSRPLLELRGRHEPSVDFGNLLRLVDTGGAVILASLLVVLAAARAQSDPDPAALATFAGVAVGLGATGGIIVWLLAPAADESEQGAGLLILYGSLLFATGAARYLGLSVVSTGMCFGITLCLVPRRWVPGGQSLTTSTRRHLEPLRLPAQAILWLLAGAALHLDAWWSLAATPVFVLLRLGAKGVLARRLAPASRVPRWLSLACPGGLSVALALQLPSWPAATEVLILGTVISEAAVLIGLGRRLGEAP